MGFCYGKSIRSVFILLLLSLMVSSCTEQKFLFFINRNSVRNAPADTPFVYNIKINIESKEISKTEKNNLSAALPAYLDDSLRVQKVQRFGIFYRTKNPPVFDTMNITRSVKFMDAFLNAQGYYQSSFSDSFYIDTSTKKIRIKTGKKRETSNVQEERATVVFTLNPGKVTIIDSLKHDLGNTALQRIAVTESTQKKTLINAGKSPFSKPLLGNELDRLVNVYKTRGYMLISRDNLIAEADTIDRSLLDLSTDPFEQIQTIAQAAQRRQEHPTATITIKTREIRNDSTDLVDSSQLQRYRIGNMYYYPEASYTQLPDSLMREQLPILYSDNMYTEYGTKGLFKFQPLRQHTFMRKGSLYNERLYVKTMNNLSSIGAWQNIESRYAIRHSAASDSGEIRAKIDTVDYYFFLSPAAKQNFTVSLEASRNTGDFLTSGNLFGLAVNATYLNRNVWRRAIQASTTLRNGVELSLNKNNTLLQTFQSSLDQKYVFPNFIMPGKNFFFKRRERLDGVKTIFDINGSYSERSELFRIRSFNTNWGYEWKVRNKIWQVKLPNIELYSLDTLPLLVKQLQNNPFLRTAFNTGSIVSIIGSFSTTYPSPNHPSQTNFFRAAVEEAGLLTGSFKTFRDRVYRYIKMETEYSKKFSFPSASTSFVIRGFAGFGYNYGDVGVTLPFYKQFVAGGPNSMRAWSLRQLGLGSSLLSDTSGIKGNAFRDRYGDVQLELNLEYRYSIAQFSSLKLDGALFSDIGNVWNIKKDINNPNSELNINRLGKDFAIGVGTGVRFDFNYFLIRIDGGIKLKDPARLENNGWLDVAHFTWRNKEFERKDEKGNVISPNRNNFAIQLGIGLPF